MVWADAADYIPYLTGQKVDNSTDRESILVLNAIIIPLTLIACGTRLCVRVRMLRSSGLDDLLLAAGLLSSLWLSISSLFARHFGLGKHIWNLSAIPDLPDVTATVVKWLYSCFIAYTTSISFIKFALIATCFRVFPSGNPIRKIFIAIGVLVAAFWISSVFAILFTCVPIYAAWTFNASGRCYPVVDYFYAFAAFNILTDVLLCLLPIPTLWALSMSKLQRVILCLLFSLGTFTCIASIVRITQLHLLINGFDVTYQIVSPLNWSVIEVGTAMVCVSLSALRPLVSRMFPRLLLNTNTQDVTLNVSDELAMLERDTSIFITREVTQTSMDSKALPALPPPATIFSTHTSKLSDTSSFIESTCENSQELPVVPGTSDCPFAAPFRLVRPKSSAIPGSYKAANRLQKGRR